MQSSQPTTKPRRSVIHRLARVFLKIILTIIIILIIVIFLVQTPYVQDIARSKAEKYLSRKLKTRVSIGKLDISFPESIRLDNIYIEDRKKDTLLSAGLVYVNINMWGLLHNELDIHALQLAGITMKVKRQLPDTAFNFQFIADAFAGSPDTTAQKKSSAPMKMVLQEIMLDKIRLVYQDTVTGNDVVASIDHNRTKIDTFDPANLHFGVSSFQLKGLVVKIRQSPPLFPASASATAATASSPAPASSGPAAAFNLQLRKIELESSSLDYQNTINAFFANLQLGRLTADVKTLDLNRRTINLNELRLDSTTTIIHMGIPVARSAPGATAQKMAVAPPMAPDPSGDWHFTAASVELNGNHFQYDDDHQRRQPKGMDYAHLDINRLTLHASNLSYNKDSISGAVTEGAFRERSGFELDQLRVGFLYTDRQTVLRELLVRTPGTLLQRSATLTYSSLAAMMKDAAHTHIDLDLADSRVQVKDILTFAPFLSSQPAFSHPQDTWKVNAHIGGTLDALDIRTLQFSGIGDIRLDVAGTILHPLDAKRIDARMAIRDISGSRQSLLDLIPKNSLPSNIAIPARFSLHGKLDGGMAGFNSDLVLNTSSGNILLKGFVRQFRDTRNASYDLALQTQSLDLGYILKDTATWGRFTSAFTLKGQGLDQHSAHAAVHGKIASATIKSYTYKDLSLDGSIADQHAEFSSSIENTAIHFELKASADLSRKFPALKLDWMIDTADLYTLHLVKDTVTVRGHLLADFQDTNPDSLQGNMKLANLFVVNGHQRLGTDSITLLAVRKEDIEQITMHSEMADLDWSGKYKLTEVAQALQHTITKYYRSGGYTAASAARDSASFTGRADGHADGYADGNAGDAMKGSAVPGKDSAFSPEDWTLQLHLRPSPLVLVLMPALKGTDSAGATLSFNSDRNDLHLQVSDPRIQMGITNFRNVAINASTSDQQLKYALLMSGATGSGYDLYHTSVQGYLANNQLFTTVLLKDSKNDDRYRVAGRLDKLKDGLKFSMNPDSLLLDYDNWKVSRDNFFRYDSAGITVNDFKISNQAQSLQIASNPPAATSPIEVTFTDFKLATLGSFADQDSLLVDGTLNGKAVVKNALTSPVFTSDLKIAGLSYKGDTVGNFAIKVNNEKANAYSADITLDGNQNDINVKGEYYTGESRLDMKLDLRQLNLASIKPFAASQVTDMRGFLKGSLAITGSPDKPGITGKLHFDSTVITPVISGEPLKISNDNIEFDADGFNFSEFAFRDSAGNKATIDGNVYTKDYKDFKFDVTVNAGNFRLVNAPQASNRLFYGKMNLDVAANLSGDMASPKVDGSLRVNKKTDFSFVLPEDDPEVVDREGVVRFIDKNHPSDTLANNQIHIPRQTSIQGMELSLNIETDSNAVFTIVIDERNGDALSVRGRSNLVFGMNKTGKMDLTGAFEVESGTYNLSLSALKRKFVIQHGSTITWTGDPTAATVDMTADYTANTPSIDLIANEISSRTPTEINKFKQKLPFLVTLKMEGDLLKPKITFDITLPADVLTLWPDVDQKLQQIRVQESELNKQVFALLLLNRFVGEDPLQSAAGGGVNVSSIAFQSASQILTNQLNQLAGSLIKGVDINFDLNQQQDFSTGTENDYTELNVSVSKRLFNERINVNVGSNFDVQGTGGTNSNASNIAGDLAVDYKLTKDGRYMLRAYRKNQYEAVIEGQVVETGVSFILTFDYNRFKEIFGRTKEEKLEERTRSKPVPVKPANPTVTPPANRGTGGSGSTPGSGGTPGGAQNP